MHAVHEQPVVGGQRRQPRAGVDVVGSLGDVDVHADAEVGGEAGGRGQRVVGARERGVHADHAPAAGAQEALVLGQPAAGAVGRRGGRSRRTRTRPARRPRRRRRRSRRGCPRSRSGSRGGRRSPSCPHCSASIAPSRRRPADHLEVERGVEAPPDLLEDLDEVGRLPRRRRHARAPASSRGGGGRTPGPASSWPSGSHTARAPQPRGVRSPRWGWSPTTRGAPTSRCSTRRSRRTWPAPSREHGDREALVSRHQGIRWTYREFAERVERSPEG